MELEFDTEDQVLFFLFVTVYQQNKNLKNKKTICSNSKTCWIVIVARSVGDVYATMLRRVAVPRIGGWGEFWVASKYQEVGGGSEKWRLNI